MDFMWQYEKTCMNDLVETYGFSTHSGYLDHLGVSRQAGSAHYVIFSNRLGNPVRPL